MNKISTTKINALINSSLSNLKSHFRSIDNRNGWHQYLGSEKVGNIATSQALILLDMFNYDFNKRHLAIDFLISSQLSKENDFQVDGGWTYVTSFSDLPTTEATCWTLKALYSTNRNHPNVKKGLQWLLNNHQEWQTDSGWGTIKSDTSRVYTTCLALEVLFLYNFNENKQFENGLNWLLKSQNTDGGWGEKPGFPSTLTHTSMAILTLKNINFQNASYFKDSTKWILSIFTTVESSTWNNHAGFQEIMEFNYKKRQKSFHKRLTYYHLPIPLATKALIKTGNIDNEIVGDSLQYIIASCNNGYWNHPHLETNKIKPIWAIFEMLTTFKSLKEIIPDWEDTSEIQFKKNKILFIKTANPFELDFFIKNFILGVWGKIFAIILVCILIIGILKIFPNLEKVNYIALILIPLIVELLGFYITEIRKRQ